MSAPGDRNDGLTDVDALIQRRAREGFSVTAVVFTSSDGQVAVSARGADVAHLFGWIAEWWNDDIYGGQGGAH